MSRTNETFSLTSNKSQPAGEAGIWFDLNAQEAVDAALSGTGPGQPNALGTPQLGTIAAGYGVEMNAQGNAILATSPDLSAALPKLFMVVAFGNDDNNHAFADGKLVAVHGGVRFETNKIQSGAFTKGGALVLVSGVWTRATQGNSRQVAGWVGPRGKINDTVLDVVMPQGMGARA